MSNKNLLDSIKKLRELTGVGFKDCKIALDENNNDIEKSRLSFGNFDYYNNALKLCDFALKEVAEQNNNVFFVNVKTQIESNIENMQDHIHPTFTGSKKIANVLADFINKIF